MLRCPGTSGRIRGRYSELVTILDLRTVKIRSGEQFRDLLEVELEPLQLAGQRYIPTARDAGSGDRRLAGSRPGDSSSSRSEPGSWAPVCGVSRTRLSSCLSGPGSTTPRIRGTPTSSPTPYIEDDKLDLSAWARDSLVLDLPDKILCRDDCAGLCPGCGADLNHEACTCGPEEPDTRWAALSELRDRL